jgi:hypothetical protein
MPCLASPRAMRLSQGGHGPSAGHYHPVTVGGSRWTSVSKRRLHRGLSEAAPVPAQGLDRAVTPPIGPDTAQSTTEKPGGSPRGPERQWPMPAAVTGITLVAAIASIPSFGALAAFPVGALAVLAGVGAWHWREQRFVRTGFFAAACVLLLIFTALMIGAARTSTPVSSGGVQLPTGSVPETARSTSTSPTFSASEQPTRSPSASVRASTVVPRPKPVTTTILQGQSYEFSHGDFLVGVPSVFGSWVSLTLSTKSIMCSANLDVGERKTIGRPSEGCYRATVLAVE